MRILATILLVGFIIPAHAGYDCSSGESGENVISINPQDITWLEDDKTYSDTLISLIVKLPRKYDGADIQSVELRTTTNPRFVMPLRFVSGSFGQFEKEEKTEKYYYVSLLADKSYFDGKHCVQVEYFNHPECCKLEKHRVFTTVLKLNQALKAQPSAAGDAASGAP